MMKEAAVFDGGCLCSDVVDEKGRARVVFVFFVFFVCCLAIVGWGPKFPGSRQQGRLRVIGSRWLGGAGQFMR